MDSWIRRGVTHHAEAHEERSAEDGGARDEDAPKVDRDPKVEAVAVGGLCAEGRGARVDPHGKPVVGEHHHRALEEAREEEDDAEADAAHLLEIGEMDGPAHRPARALLLVDEDRTLVGARLVSLVGCLGLLGVGVGVVAS